ncbi:hypothetical protein JQ628_04260 [Bradyrhizobium lablabi]|uniref:hypothetical protein n=1 Tax=Bradyrhizobium lablabi TaxID=722472 RepID=UPI001BA8B36E|nr:hypothetical protein [Bradyrhizobium lablabi]MBR1120719.1 hypothetical protein [Bradyrhizobium lablabi]
MSAFRLFASAAILLCLTAPALAQQVISEPGYCAFFYPNANCQNKGPGNPYTDPNAQRSMNPYPQGSMSAQGQTVGVAVKRPKKPATRRY